MKSCRDKTKRSVKIVIYSVELTSRTEIRTLKKNKEQKKNKKKLKLNYRTTRDDQTYYLEVVFIKRQASEIRPLHISQIRGVPIV